MGSLWFRVPQGGKALERADVTAVLGLVASPSAPSCGPSAAPAAVAAAVDAGSAAPSCPRSLPATAQVQARRAGRGRGAVGVVGLTAAGALLVLPEEQTSTRAVPVTQAGSFTYSGEAFPGTTYPDGRVDTGDPVYTALARALTISYEQTLASAGDLQTDGTVRLALTLTAPDGWSSTMIGGSAVPMRNSTATATVELDTAGAAALLAAHYSEVGVNGGTATLTITPEVDVEGTVDGRPFAVSPPAPLAFTLDPALLKMNGGAEALRTSGGTTVTVEELAPRTFPLGPVTLPLHAARVIALGVAVLALLVTVVATWLGGARTTSEVDRFLQRRAARVVAVARFIPDGTVVDLADPEALHKVAERLDGLVLHHAGPDVDTFAVRDVGTTYRCVVPRAVVPEPKPRPVRTGRLLGRFA